MELNYPIVAVFYNLLEKYKKSALYYYSIFVFRRLSVALVYVILKDYQGS